MNSNTQLQTADNVILQAVVGLLHCTCNIQSTKHADHFEGNWDFYVDMW